MKRKMTAILAAALVMTLLLSSALALSYTINFVDIPENDVSRLNLSASEWLSSGQNRAMLTVATFRALSGDSDVKVFEPYLKNSMVCYRNGQMDVYIVGSTGDIMMTPPVGKDNTYFWYFIYDEAKSLDWLKSERRSGTNWGTDHVYENAAADIDYALAHYNEFFGGSGSASDGWKEEGGSWYYYRNGQKVTGWLQDGAWYYFDAAGRMQTGWVQSGGAWYYMSGSGAMLSGWQNLGGTWYYFQGDGSMATGWQLLGGVWYYFTGSGNMVTGQQNIGGTVYTFSSDGAWLY